MKMLKTKHPQERKFESRTDDWQKWKTFLLVKVLLFSKRELLRKPETFFEISYGIPAGVCQAMVRGAGHFEEIEIWGQA